MCSERKTYGAQLKYPNHVTTLTRKQGDMLCYLQPNDDLCTGISWIAKTINSQNSFTFIRRNSCNDDTGCYQHPGNPRNSIHEITGASSSPWVDVKGEADWQLTETSVFEVCITILMVDICNESKRDKLEDGYKVQCWVNINEAIMLTYREEQ